MDFNMKSLNNYINEVLVKNNLKHNNNFERIVLGSKEYEELFNSPTGLKILYYLDLPISYKSFINFINKVDEYAKSKNIDISKIIIDIIKPGGIFKEWKTNEWEIFYKDIIHELKTNKNEIDMSILDLKILDIACNIVLTNKNEFNKTTCNYANSLLKNICYSNLNKDNL